MRKIEQDMCAAVMQRRDWRSGNTEVVQTEDGCMVRLHGNIIASVLCCRNTGVFSVRPDIDTLRHWPTRTTLSRLRALGVDVRVHSHVVYLDGEALE